MRDPKITAAWQAFLDPTVTRPRLISAALFITAFEMLKDSIVSRIREFFTFGADEKGEQLSPKYAEVLRRKPSPLYASLDWLKEMEAIDESDLALFERAKKCRNHLAHELGAVIASEGLPPDFEEIFEAMVGLFQKIERWWVANVEIPTNPDFLGEEIDPESITPGRIMMFQVLCQVALGPENESRQYLEEFQRAAKKHQGA